MLEELQKLCDALEKEEDICEKINPGNVSIEIFPNGSSIVWLEKNIREKEILYEFETLEEIDLFIALSPKN